MPRSKNPNPKKQFTLGENQSMKTDENANNLLTEEATEDSAEKVCSARSLSPTNTEPIENDDKSEDLIKNEDDKDYDTKKQTPDNGIEQQPELSGNEEDSFLDTADNFDKPAKESKNQHYLGVGSSPGKTKRSTNLASTNILSWLQKRFVLRENARTSAAQVIQLYEKEFADDSVAPLQSYQVGQLLRRIFPNLQRCKITIDGRRVWVYKHLCIKDDDYQHQTKDGERTGKKMDCIEINNNFSGQNIRAAGKKARSPSPAFSDVRRSAKNSAMLYNLLHSVKGDSQPQSTFRTHGLPKSCRDESIIDWLRENYEYADGYFVKSLNVLKKYNQGRQTEVRYLSQVGRIIKHVFPHARHLRRSLKGGKREWVYHNIRPKDHTENDRWKGSRKSALLDSSSRYDSRPSMVPIPKFSLKKPLKLERSDKLDGYANSKQKITAIPEKFSYDSILNNKAIDPDKECFYSGNLSLSSSELKPRSTPSPDFTSVFFKNDLKNVVNSREGNDCSGILDQERENDAVNLKSLDEKHAEASFDKSQNHLLDGLTCDKLNLESDDFPFNGVATGGDEAEDLSMSSKESSAPKKRNFDEISNADSPDQNLSRVAEMNSSGRKMLKTRDFTRKQGSEHNYPFAQVVDSDLRVKNFIKPCSSSNLSDRLHQSDFAKPNSFNRADGEPDCATSGSRSVSPYPLQWEDLSMCDAHRFGWTLTPTLNNEIPSNFIEWILFEGQLLRDGQRVFRELKIYDDWSVSIHAMGKKVHPDELGGITDLSRTKKSVIKVFATLAGARACRGLPALCLSDLCVHGVVVARTEIWSSRENNCEELRHRAINCQVLYNSNEESCPKCYRVIRMHSQSVSTTSGNNGYASKETRFTSRVAGSA